MALGDYHYYGKREFAAAAREYEWVLQRQPGNSDAIALSALILRRQAEWAKSTHRLGEAMKLDPRNTVWAEGQGQTCMHLGRFDEAHHWLSRAADLAPDVPYYYLWLAWLELAWHGDTGRVRETLHRAARWVAPLDLLTDQEASWLVLDLFGPEYSEVLEAADPGAEGVDRAFLWLARAEVLSQAHDVESAREAWELSRLQFERRVDEAPGVLAPCHYLAFVYARLGMREEALEQADRSLEIMPVSLDAMDGSQRLLHFARTSVVLGDYDRAVELIGRLVEVPILLTPAMLRCDPFWSPLVGHAEYDALIAR